MDAFKGVFRRANQGLKQKTGRAEATSDETLENAVKRLRAMEKFGLLIMDKVAKLSNCLEEIGTLCNGIAEDYKNTIAEGITSHEMVQLAMELGAFGQESVSKANELQRNLRENAYENIGAYSKEVPQLKNLEEDRKKKQLEYDFFKNKVAALIKDPPKDSTRIPRNELIRENWRTQLWQSTENMKSTVSNMTLSGQKVLDSAVYTVAMTVGNFAGYVVNSAKNHFVNAHMPAYPGQPLLPPKPLSPPPPPYQPPQVVPYGGQYGTQFGSPQQQQQQQPPQQFQSPPQGYQQSPGPQIQPVQAGWSSTDPQHQQGWQQQPQQQPQQQQPQQNWGQQSPQAQPQQYASQNSFGAPQDPQQQWVQPQQQQQPQTQQYQQQPQAGWGAPQQSNDQQPWGQPHQSAPPPSQ